MAILLLKKERCQMTWKIQLKGMMLAADTCMLLISYCKQMMIDFRVLDRAQVLEIMIQGFLDYRDNYVEKSSPILKSP